MSSLQYDALVPEVVTLHVWGIPYSRIPQALGATVRDRRPVAQAAGHTFHRLLGTGGAGFTPGDADLRHWALLACWSHERAAAAFEQSAVVRRWDGRAAASPAGERLRVAMKPLSSKGRWDGRQPFGDPQAAATTGAVAVLTRARLRPRQAPAFWRAAPPVSDRLASSPGLIAALGIGERPIGRQGTFSLWESAEAMTAFAYGSAEHRRVMAQTRELGWYGEELFARFAVAAAEGSFRGTAVRIVT